MRCGMQLLFSLKPVLEQLRVGAGPNREQLVLLAFKAAPDYILSVWKWFQITNNYRFKSGYTKKGNWFQITNNYWFKSGYTKKATGSRLLITIGLKVVHKKGNWFQITNNYWFKSGYTKKATGFRLLITIGLKVVTPKGNWFQITNNYSFIFNSRNQADRQKTNIINQFLQNTPKSINHKMGSMKTTRYV